MSKLNFQISPESQLLQEQLSWYERALATSEDALWRWDLSDDSLLFSAASHADLEAPNQQHPKTMQGWCAFIHPDDADHARQSVVDHLKNQAAQLKLTLRIRNKQNNWIWVLITGQVTERNAQGKALYCMGHMQKIDEQVRTERELERTRQRFSLALRSARCGLWSWDFTTDHVEVRIYHERHPDNEHEVLSTNFDDIETTIHPHDLRAFAEITTAYRMGKTGMIEGVWRVKNRSGGYRWILNRGEIIERDAQGHPKLAIGTHTDITTQKQVEEDLINKTELFNLAYKNTLESLWDWNPESGTMYVSSTWLRALGYDEDHTLLFQELAKHIHAHDAAGVTRKLNALVAGDFAELSCEFRVLLHGIGYIWVMMRGHVATRSLSGHVHRVVGTITNISSLKEKTLLLQKNEHRLELAMRGANSSLFDFNLITNNYETWSFHEGADGVEEKIDHAPLKERLASIHPEDRPIFNDYLKSFSVLGNDFQEARWRSRQFSDDYRWTLSKGRVVERDVSGQPIRIVGTYQDIHEQVLTEEQANLEHKRLQYAFEGTGDALWDLDIASSSAFVSPSWIESLGYNPNTWRYDLKNWGDLIHPEDKPVAKAALQAHYRGETDQYVAEYRVLNHAGNWNWVLARGKVVERDAKHQPTRVIGTLFNINNRKKIEQHLASAKELAETTLHAIADAVITTDRDGLIQSVNKTAEQLIAKSVTEIENQPLGDVIQLVEEDSNDPIDNPALFSMTADLTVELDTNTLLKNHLDEVYAVQCKASPIHGADGKPIGSVLILQDITASRNLTREIEHRSKHDPLTQLINRYEFEQRLEHLLDQPNSGPHALCYMDLDQFKLVNDTCGHMAGDELLRQLSAELSRVVRHSDSLGRLGGDEFALLMEDCSLEQAQRVAKNIHDAITGFSFSWDDKNFKLGVSIGLVSVNSNISPQLALQHADAACFVAKEQGRNRIHVHQDDDDQIALRQGEMGWIPRIQRALDQDLFTLYSQAIIDLGDPDHRISHFEILLRMREGDQTIPPGAFLPAAERYNLSPKLDQWVLTHTLRIIRQYCEGRPSDVSFNINLSAHSLNEPGFLQFIQQRIKDYGVHPGNLCFEITETAAITNLTHATHFIETLKTLGCEFALDDFGSGLSSFAYLKNFPVDYLKIDGAFIRDLVEDEIDAAMVKSINEIGQIMNKKTVAEWVENQAIADKLIQIGVNYAQGYHFSVPEPFDQALARVCQQSMPA